MNNWRMNGPAVVLPVLMLFSPIAMGEILSGDPEVNATKSLVVMIEDNLNGEPTQGAGIVFAVDKNWTYIATAYHLVKRGDLRATDLKVRFWQKQETFQAEIYDDKNRCDCDLAVLRVKIPDTAFEFRRLADPEQLRPSQLVHAIGHPNDEVAWNFIYLAGAITEIEPSYLKVQYPSIKEGDSGGPLVDEHGMIIGMVLGTDGTTVKVLSMDRIADILRRDLHLTVGLSLIPFSRFTVDDGSTSFRAVASNDPQHGNIWYSLAQTFTARDEHVLFGFRLADSSGSLPNAGTSVIYNLYTGENSYSKLLTSKTVQLSHALSRNDARNAFGDVGFVFADFSDVDLTIGQSYTVEIKAPTFPTIGSSSPIKVWTSSRDPYHGGRFYFPPATVNSASNASFIQDDMLFEVVHRGGMATYELNMRLGDGGSVRGYFKFDGDAAMAAPGAAGDRFTAARGL
jgi:Trypsin-like peptidase domain